MTKPDTLQALARLSVRQLDDIFREGTLPDPEELVGWEFMGHNPPVFAKLMGISKFQKGFYRYEGEVWGYNIPQVQNPIDQPWCCKPNDADPKRFGFYSVKKVGEGAAESLEPGSLLFNYNDGKNKIWEGSFLRDYIKRVDPANHDLYLGKAFMALGGARVFSNYFIIQRLRKAPTEPRHLTA